MTSTLARTRSAACSRARSGRACVVRPRSGPRRSRAVAAPRRPDSRRWRRGSRCGMGWPAVRGPPAAAMPTLAPERMRGSVVSTSSSSRSLLHPSRSAARLNQRMCRRDLLPMPDCPSACFGEYSVRPVYPPFANRTRRHGTPSRPFPVRRPISKGRLCGAESRPPCDRLGSNVVIDQWSSAVASRPLAVDHERPLCSEACGLDNAWLGSGVPGPAS